MVQDHPVDLFDYMWSGFTYHLKRFTATYSHKRKRTPLFGRERENILGSIRKEITRIQSLLDNESYTVAEPPSHREFHLVVLVVIAALLNPVTTRWAVTRFAERVKNTHVTKDGSEAVADQNLKKYFEESNFGQLHRPTTILDCHGYIMVWYLPGIFTKRRTDGYNSAILGIDSSLHHSMNGSKDSWRSQGFRSFRPAAKFHPGAVNLSPGWFMQAHDRLEDEIHVSETLYHNEMANFLPSIANSEVLSNAVLALVSPELYNIGLEAINQLKQSQVQHIGHPNVALWPSVYSGMQIIVNRETPAHRDRGAAPPVYDMLVSAGTHTASDLYLADIKTALAYGPGTVVALCGRVLRHEVMTWEGGERICVAHYMKDNVHERLKLPMVGWVKKDNYCSLMEEGFHDRCCNH